MQKQEIVFSIISTILGSSVLNGIVTHILYNNKLKKELKYKGNNMIAQDIANSLQAFRNLVSRLGTIEIFQIENELEEHGSQVNLFNDECIYPAIFNSWNSYNEFMDQIHTCRKEHEKNYSCRIALNLVFIDRYIKQLSLFMSEHGTEADLPIWGTIFIFDLQKWQTHVDKLLIKEINKYNYKLESHRTPKWNRLRKKEVEKRYNQTFLHYFLTGQCHWWDKKRMQFAKLAINQIFNNDTSDE